ncbi:uncharacterized protein [Tursiops truncatus]|uniref:uncharacterized protein n=1 Tax=Tursiops truncatus TaxID=9739 RepID=UPI003CCF658F
MAGRTSQKSCEAEPRVLPSQSLLQEDDPEPPSQQLQATGSRGSEPRSNLDLSRGPLVALEYLPFFRTYGQLLAEEELAPRPEVCRDRGGDQSIREEDSEPPSGFFPYYRSKEERFPSLALPGRWCAGSRDPPAWRELQACCCCRTTVSGRCSAGPAGPDLISGLSHSPTRCPTLLASAGHSRDSGLDALVYSDVAFGGQALCAPGFVPYYRSPEECLRTSPGPPACPLWGQESTGKLPGPGAASLRRNRCWGRQGRPKNGPQHLMISTQAVKWLAVRLPELSSPWTWSWPGTAAFRPSFSPRREDSKPRQAPLLGWKEDPAPC